METVARFLTEDTYRGRSHDPLSLNLYTYCHNNPLRYTDPSGHIPIPLLLGLLEGSISAGIEIYNQVVVEKRKDVTWEAVAFEFSLGFISGTVGGGIGGKAVRKAVGSTVKTVGRQAAKKGTKEVLKKVGKAFLTESVSGFATDVAKQVLVEDKSLKEVDYGQAFETAAVSGVFGGVMELGSAAISKVVDSAAVLVKKSEDS